MTSPPLIQAAERIEAAGQLAIEGKIQEAENIIAELLRIDPGQPDAIAMLGSLAIIRKDAKRAFAILSAASTQFPNNARLISNLGTAYSMLGKPTEATVCMKRAVALVPLDVELRLNLAHFLMLANDLDGALLEVQTVLQQSPNNIDGVSKLASIYIAQNNLKAAEATLSRAFQLDPKNAEVNHNLSVLCFSVGRFEDAVKYSERATLWAPLDIGKRLQFARTLAAIGNTEAARENCVQVLIVAPEHQPATELFARLTLLNGNVPAGLETLTHFVRKHPQDINAILALARALRLVGRTAKALEFVEQALIIDRAHLAAKTLRTKLTMELWRFDEILSEAPSKTMDEPSYFFVPKGMSPVDTIVYARLLKSIDRTDIDITCLAGEFESELLAYVDGINLQPPREEEAFPVTGLPAFLRLNSTLLRPVGRFLKQDPVLAEKWRRSLADFDRPFIGIYWDKYPPGLQAQTLIPALEGNGTLISLSTEPERHDLANYPNVIDAAPHIDSAANLIALLSNLDLLVATDGLPLHVAGALNQPAIGFIPCGFPWYFHPHSDKSPLYQSIHLLRQKTPANWDEPMRLLPDSLKMTLSVSKELRS